MKLKERMILLEIIKYEIQITKSSDQGGLWIILPNIDILPDL